MSSFEGRQELAALLTWAFPWAQIRAVSFGVPAPKGLLDAFNTVAGMLDNDGPIVQQGAAIALVEQGLIVAGVSRRREPLAIAVRWALDGPPGFFAWQQLGALAPVCTRQAKNSILLELSLAGGRQRLRLWDGNPGLPSNGAEGTVIADAVDWWRAQQPSPGR